MVMVEAAAESGLREWSCEEEDEVFLGFSFGFF